MLGSRNENKNILLLNGNILILLETTESVMPAQTPGSTEMH